MQFCLFVFNPPASPLPPLRQGFHCIVSSGWTGTCKNPPAPASPNAGITGVCHHTLLSPLLNKMMQPLLKTHTNAPTPLTPPA